MVRLKRLDYGLNGYQVPFIPRAARSARRRAPVNKVRCNQICAYNLLSTAADDRLLETECLPSSGSMSTEKKQTFMVKTPVEKEDLGEQTQVKVEPQDRGRCNKGFPVSGLVSQANNQKCKSKNPPLHLNSNPGFSLLSTSDCLNNSGSENMVVGDVHECVRRESMEVDTTSFGYRGASHCEFDCQPENEIKVELLKEGVTENDTMGDMFGLDDFPNSEQSHAPIAADNNVKMSLYRDQSPNTFAHSRDSIHVVGRDDDDNSSGCTHPITIAKSLRPASRFGHQRTKKLLASRSQKESSGSKIKQFCKSDGVSKPIYHSHNSYLDYLKSQKNYPFKKRKFLYCNYVSDSDGDISSESISDRPTKGRKEGTSVSGQKTRGAGKPSIAARRRAFQSKTSQGMNLQPIKLRIKSFTVPELFIEIPETSTVGSLKRTVLEAVTPLLHGGLRVGMLVQGKKVKDDRRTLLQTGISHVHKLDALDFTLEPSPTTTSQTSIFGDYFPCNEDQSLARYSSPSTALQQTSATLHESHLENASSDTASDHDSAPSPTGISTDKKTANSSALVAVSAMDNALTLNPKNQKRKQSECTQRRIRRPFSVVEVETLVQAVEKLGTGRWREVKLQAFDNSEHRTYVDLKDKWKTLVHTARISPQQRRGEPVPQDLLDRVLTAHAYWSQQ